MKSKFIIALTITFLSVGVKTTAQTDKSHLWNGKQCAVVLTYDDATDFHLDNVIPVLDSLGLRATFYVPGSSASIYERMDEWREAAQKGHELGNHTIYHPCHGKSKNRKWVRPDYDLDNYTISRFINEIKVNNTLLKAIDGKTVRTFAYTCGDTSIGDSSFIDLLKDYFIAARGVKPGLNYIDNTNLFNIKTFGVNKKTADELIKLIERERAKNAMITLLFHGVGGGNPFSMTTEEHSKFIHYLKQNEDKILIAPMVEAVKNWKLK